jgi:uncharacterized Zn finger protein (UPF0148 family)
MGAAHCPTCDKPYADRTGRDPCPRCGAENPAVAREVSARLKAERQAIQAREKNAAAEAAAQARAEAERQAPPPPPPPAREEPVLAPGEVEPPSHAEAIWIGVKVFFGVNFSLGGGMASVLNIMFAQPFGLAVSIPALAIGALALRSGRRRPCPACAESIVWQAKLCPYCRTASSRAYPTRTVVACAVAGIALMAWMGFIIVKREEESQRAAEEFLRDH